MCHIDETFVSKNISRAYMSLEWKWICIINVFCYYLIKPFGFLEILDQGLFFFSWQNSVITAMLCCHLERDVKLGVAAVNMSKINKTAFFTFICSGNGTISFPCELIWAPSLLVFKNVTCRGDKNQVPGYYSTSLCVQSSLQRNLMSGQIYKSIYGVSIQTKTETQQEEKC